MITTRIIPCLDVRDGRVVKGKQFENIIDVDDPAVLAKKYALSGADELVFYDITASHERREIAFGFVEAVAREINIPFSVGGGIDSVEMMRMILRKGADKISINSAAVKNPTLITEGAERFGSQCIVLSIDAKRVGDAYKVFINGGRVATDLDVISWAQEGVRLGAGEIVLNTMDTDGMLGGYDTRLLALLKASVTVPVIASGGAGELTHFVDGVKIGKADGLLAASVFHFGTFSIDDVKRTLAKEKILVRMEVEDYDI